MVLVSEAAEDSLAVQFDPLRTVGRRVGKDERGGIVDRGD